MGLAGGPDTPREPGRAPKLRRHGDMYSSSADASIDGGAPDSAMYAPADGVPLSGDDAQMGRSGALAIVSRAGFPPLWVSHQAGGFRRFDASSHPSSGIHFQTLKTPRRLGLLVATHWMGNPVHPGRVLEQPSRRGFILVESDFAVDQAGTASPVEV